MRLAHFALIAATVAPVTFAGAQEACYKGPGSAFGVTAYNCSSCGYASYGDGVTRGQYIFHAAPVILSTAQGSALRNGDVIEAVDGHPITTREGAEAFSYPTPGRHALKIRRNGNPVDLAVDAACPSSDTPRRPPPSSPRQVLDSLGITRVLPAPS